MMPSPLLKLFEEIGLPIGSHVRQQVSGRTECFLIRLRLEADMRRMLNLMESILSHLQDQFCNLERCIHLLDSEDLAKSPHSDGPVF